MVDNGSSDGSGEIARRAGARVLERPQLRVGGCRNAGAAVSRGQILAFVDADNEIAPGWLQACVSVFGEGDVGVAGYPYSAPVNATWVQQLYDAMRVKPARRRDVEWLGAGNLAIRRTAFDQVGGFDEALEACEDVRLCHAVHRAGYRVVSEPGMGSVHHGDPRTLTALFRGELWRGRDNLGVTLRGPLTARGLAGALLPVVGLACLAGLMSGAIATPWLGPVPLLIAAAGFAGIAAVRSAIVIRRGRLKGPLSWARALAVAATYETARAAALVTNATHGTRLQAPRHA